MLSPLAATRVLGPLAVGGPAGGAASSLLTGLLAAYNFDEVSGDRLDVSGNGRTLTQSGLVGSQAGVIGNGTYVPTAGGHYLTRAYDSGLHCATQMGLSVWVKTLASDNVGRALLCRGYAAAATFQWILYRNGQTGSNDNWILYIGAATASWQASAAAWGHLAISWDGTKATNAERLRVWAGGVEKTLTFTGTVPATLTDNSSHNLYVHTRRPSVQEFAGGLDLLNIHGRPYTADEVATLYNAGAGKAYPFS